MRKQNLIQTRFLLSVIFILITLLIECAKDNAANKREILFGWAGSPDNPLSKPFDYFYTTNSARVSTKAIQSKNVTLLKKKCNKAVAFQGKDSLVRHLMISSFPEGCSSLYCGKYYERETRIYPSNVLLVSCASDDGPILPEILGLHRQLMKSLKIQHIHCKPIAIADPNIEGSEWKECECTVYAHIPGGRKTIWEQCIELEKKFESKR